MKVMQAQQEAFKASDGGIFAKMRPTKDKMT